MTYVYKCKDCGKEQEVVKDLKDSALEEYCKYCISSTPLQRIFSSSAIKTSDGYKL